MKGIIFFLSFTFLSNLCFAEKITLKSGKTIDGKIIQQTDAYIKVEFEGIPLTLYLDEIESIDGEKILPSQALSSDLDKKELLNKIKEGFNKIKIMQVKSIQETSQNNNIIIKGEGVSHIDYENKICSITQETKFPFSDGGAMTQKTESFIIDDALYQKIKDNWVKYKSPQNKAIWQLREDEKKGVCPLLGNNGNLPDSFSTLMNLYQEEYYYDVHEGEFSGMPSYILKIRKEKLLEMMKQMLPIAQAVQKENSEFSFEDVSYQIFYAKDNYLPVGLEMQLMMASSASTPLTIKTKQSITYPQEKIKLSFDEKEVIEVNSQEELNELLLSTLDFGGFASSQESSFENEWQKDREKAIEKLIKQVKEEKEMAAYGYLKFSDKGIQDIEKASLVFESEFFSGAWAHIFKDGSFYWTHGLEQGEEGPIEVTLKASRLGYEVAQKKFIGESGSISNLGEIVLKKLPQENLSAGIKGKILLPGKEDHSRVEVKIDFERQTLKTHTSPDGSFQFTTLQPGKYSIYFSHPYFIFLRYGRLPELHKDEILDLGEIKAIKPAVVHIEWVREKEPNKGFEGGRRGKAVISFMERGERGFDIDKEEVGKLEYPYEHERADVQLSYQIGYPLLDSRFSVSDELFFSFPVPEELYRDRTFGKKTESFDLGEKTLEQAIEKLAPKIKTTSYYNYNIPKKNGHASFGGYWVNEPLLAGHCYVVRSTEGYLSIIRVVKIER